MQRLVLILKSSKPLDDPSSYRSICLLDMMGKLLESVVYERLLLLAEENGAVSNNQYGFMRARSTIDVIKHLIRLASHSIVGDRWKDDAKKYCALITLDVKNAFNSADWRFYKSARRERLCWSQSNLQTSK